jgi:hypothetical protein
MTKQIGRNMWQKYKEFITFFSDVFLRTQKNTIYLYNKTGYRYRRLLGSSYSICTLFFISCLFFQYLYVTILPWSRILINERNITITKLTHTYTLTCTHKDANVYECAEVTFHTLVPWSSMNKIYLVTAITAPSYRTNAGHPTGKWHALSQRFPNIFARGILSVSKNNLGSSHP